MTFSKFYDNLKTRFQGGKIQKELRVLVVEDEAPIRRIIVRIVSALGNFALTEAGTGDLAFELMTSSEFDLLITDFKFPNGDGNQVAKAFRERFPNSKIIGTTGNYGEHFNKKLLNYFLPKPFSIGDVEKAIRTVTQ